MSTRLYVGSLPFSATEETLAEFFSKAGVVLYAKIIKNKETGQSRGFGFIEMATDKEAQAALKLNETKFDERSLIVKEAWPNENFQQKKGDDHVRT